jgi:hypothetical protein
MKRVSSITISPVQPSLPLCYHLGYCRAISNVVGTQADGTPPRRLLCNLGTFVSKTLELAYGQRPSKNSNTTTLEATP